MSDTDRGVSDVVGYVLLVGVVTAGIATILLLGGAAVSELKGDAAATAGETSLEQADRRMSALAGTRVNATRFQLRGANPGDVRVRENGTVGYLELSVSGGACSARLPLSSVEYERPDGGTTALQAGGRFAVAADGESSVVVSPPSLSASNGTVDVTTYDLDGVVDDREVVITKNATASERRSASLDAMVRNGTACQRPTNASVTVKSPYYDAWADYLESETGLAATVNDSAQTAAVTMPQSWLPRRANDSANHVVNLSDASMATVESDGAPTAAPSYVGPSDPGYSGADNITVNKGVGNTYSAVAVPLGNGTQSSYVEQVQGDTVYRRPADVVFVVDQSGSMGDCADGSGTDDTTCFSGQSKMDAARDSASQFVADINATTDRVAFVGFNGSSRYLTTDNGTYLTSNKSAANDTIAEYEKGGSTAIETGLRKGNALHDFRADPGSQKVTILLGDGKNTVGSDYQTKQQANRAARNGVTVYTVGFGPGADEPLLRTVANRTGGQYYYASNASDLDAVFQDILSNIASTQAIVHRSTTASLSVGGQSIEPQLGYDNPNINRINGSYDINDPEYRGGFEFAARASDGNLINVTATSYDCEPGAYQVTDEFVFNKTNNRTYRRVRCTDVDNSSRTEVSPNETQIFLDGASVSALPSDDEAWYQADLVNDTLDGYVAGGELQLESNEAVVAFTYEVDGQTSRIVMLYQIGLSEGSTSVDIFDARVVRATVGDR